MLTQKQQTIYILYCT